MERYKVNVSVDRGFKRSGIKGAIDKIKKIVNNINKIAIMTTDETEINKLKADVKDNLERIFKSFEIKRFQLKLGNEIIEDCEKYSRFSLLDVARTLNSDENKARKILKKGIKVNIAISSNVEFKEKNMAEEVYVDIFYWSEKNNSFSKYQTIKTAKSLVKSEIKTAVKEIFLKLSSSDLVKNVVCYTLLDTPKNNAIPILGQKFSSKLVSTNKEKPTLIIPVLSSIEVPIESDYSKETVKIKVTDKTKLKDLFKNYAKKIKLPNNNKIDENSLKINGINNMKLPKNVGELLVLIPGVECYYENNKI